MDLSKYLSSGDEPAVEEQQPRMSKEEYAALKKQEREEVWAEIDAKAQDVFKDGDSLKGFPPGKCRLPERSDPSSLCVHRTLPPEDLRRPLFRGS